MVELGMNDTQTVVELKKRLSKKEMGVSTFPHPSQRRASASNQ